MLGIREGWTMLRQGDGRTLHMAAVGSPVTLCNLEVSKTATLFNETSHHVMSETGCKRCQRQAESMKLYQHVDQIAPEAGPGDPATDPEYRRLLPEAQAYAKQKETAMREQTSAIDRATEAVQSIQRAEWQAGIAEPEPQLEKLTTVNGMIGVQETLIKDQHIIALRRFALTAKTLRNIADDFDRLTATSEADMDSAILMRDRLAKAIQWLSIGGSGSCSPRIYTDILIDLTRAEEALTRLQRLEAAGQQLGEDLR